MTSRAISPAARSRRQPPSRGVGGAAVIRVRSAARSSFALHAVAWAASSLLALGAAAQTRPPVLPSGLNVIQGQARLTGTGNHLTVTNSANAILNWQNFSIGAGHSVRFQQPSASSQVLNRVVGKDPSNIFGSLSSNGKVWLLNPNGVLFGQGARVDVGGLVVSTLNLNDTDWLAGRYHFGLASGGAQAADVVNQGELRTTLGGRLALLGGNVRNEGLIEAPGGQLLLAAGQSIDLVDTGSPNLALRVTAPQGEALNLGTLAAASGRIDIHAAIVNQRGLVNADALQRGPAGEAVFTASSSINLDAGSVTRANGASGGGVRLNAAGGSALVGGEISAVGVSGRGGQVTLLGRQVGLVDAASVDVSGASGGGLVFVGGGKQGRDTALLNAEATYFGPQASIRADALAAGDGGRVILWSDHATRAYGSLSARGAGVGGNGGFIETSGGWLDARPRHVSVGAGATGGKAGEWLLDPNDILITDGASDTAITPGPLFTSINNSSVLSSATIVSALNAGTSVTVKTGSGGSVNQAGDITLLNATIAATPLAAVTFRLEADRNIFITDSVISSSGAPMAVELRSALGGTPSTARGSVLIARSSVNTVGGDISVGGGAFQLCGLTLCSSGTGYAVGHTPEAGEPAFLSDPSLPLYGVEQGINVTSSTLDAGTGGITLTGGSVSLDTAGNYNNGVTVNASTLRARDIRLVGFQDTASYGRGVYVQRGANLFATQSIDISGEGNQRGVSIGDAVKLLVDAQGTGGPGSLTIAASVTGPADLLALSVFGGNDVNGPTQISLSGGGSISISGNITQGSAIQINGNDFDGSPIIDASGASSLNIRGIGQYMQILDASIVAPTAGNLTVSSAGVLWIDNSSFSGAPSLANFRSTDFLEVTGQSLLDFRGGTGAVTLETIAGENGIAIRGSQVFSGGSLSLAGQGGDSSLYGILVQDSSLSANGSSGVLSLSGRSSGLDGASGVLLEGSTLAADAINLTGTGVNASDGVRSIASTTTGTRSSLTAHNLSIFGLAGNPAALPPSYVGVILQDTDMTLLSQGTASLAGDWVVLGPNTVAQGSPASFDLTASRSVDIRDSVLDFSAGGGSNVTLLSDSDSDGAGRVRLQESILRTGGGDFTVTGGTGAAIGIISDDLNFSAREGGSGILIGPATIDAGTGTVSMNGQAPADDGSGARAWGFNLNGDLNLIADTIRLTGTNPGTGLGIDGTDLDGLGTGQLNLQGKTIALTGSGGGVDVSSGLPYAGIGLASGGTWTVTPGGSVTVTSSSGGIDLTNLTLGGNSSGLILQAAGTLNLIDSAIQMGFTPIEIFGEGGLRVSNSTLSGSTVRLDGHGTGAVFADQTRIAADNIMIEGAADSGDGLRFEGTGGSVTARRNLELYGGTGSDLATGAGMRFVGDWQLSAVETFLTSDDAIRFEPSDITEPGAPGFGSPSLTGSRRLFINRDGPGSLVVGGANDQIVASELNSALANMAPESKLVFGGLRVLEYNDVTGLVDDSRALTSEVVLSGALSLPNKIRFYSPSMVMAPGASVTSSYAGDAIVVSGSAGYSADIETGNATNFDNQAGPGVFNTPNGRWLVYTETPEVAKLNGLVPAFTVYNEIWNQTDFGTDGNIHTVLPAGNGLLVASADPAPPSTGIVESTSVALSSSIAAVSLPALATSPTQGRVLDTLQAFSLDSMQDGLAFRSVPIADMSESALWALLAARDAYKKKLFADAIYQLEQDPSIAELPPCESVKDTEGGKCLITESLKSAVQAAQAAVQVKTRGKRKVKTAALPQIERKVALVIGIDRYADKRIPQLESAVSDARAIGQLIEGSLGYEAIVIENASKDTIIRSLNQLAGELDANDSVIIYYAGHGELLPRNKSGYWLPADSNAANPATWLANADIAKLVAQIGARQVALISDSCYSGSLVSDQRITAANRVDDAALLLSRRAVVVMSSGGNEPVSDQGKEGHSIFAWNLMKSLGQVSEWQAGSNVFERVRFAVKNEFPQTPQYGASPTAGHQAGGDYVFEQRTLENNP